ncbi:response regulator [Sphingomonas sp. SRS2]|uniref:response regulator n=1 Tax=Sphingomonas sp. SRS2 TaxID=133190 RepID=UPI0006184098|nr:response regulator [Sphingomonas sp. SRS2]KKC24062.1 Fis family transcriptional regulator [Sphingomonas sp. SRS2]
MLTRQPRVMIIDDEGQIRRLVAVSLQRGGFDPVEAASAAAALDGLATRPVDAALIDLGLPDRDGLELVSMLRQRADIAIIVLSARDSTADKIAALDLGADDYVTKPFDTDELLARLRSALRRRAPRPLHPAAQSFGDVTIDHDKRLIYRAGTEVRLTPKEYALLAELARHAGKVITHAQLLRTIWGPAHERDIEYLRVTTRALRLKLEQDPARPALIRNEPGIGYRLCEPGPSLG